MQLQWGPLEWEEVLAARQAETSSERIEKDSMTSTTNNGGVLEGVDPVLQRYLRRCNAERQLFDLAEEIRPSPLAIPRPGLKRAQVLQAKFADPEAKKAIFDKRKETKERMQKTNPTPKKVKDKPSKQTPRQRAANAIRAESQRMRSRDFEKWAKLRLDPGPDAGDNDPVWNSLSIPEALTAKRRKKRKELAKKRAQRKLEKQQQAEMKENGRPNDDKEEDETV